MNISEINRKIIEFWKSQDVSKRVPLIYSDELVQNALLFIGMNPSFSVKGYKSILRGTPYAHIQDLEEYFLFKNYTEDKLKAFSDIYKISKDTYQYFNKFRELSRDLKCEWEHIDLLYMRDTNQKIVEKLFVKNEPFINYQIDLTIHLIKKLTPKIIIIENAFVSKILKSKLELVWHEEIGTYLFNNNIPVFLSGMLTGGRALDLGSLERLKWHLSFVLKQIN